MATKPNKRARREKDQDKDKVTPGRIPAAIRGWLLGGTKRIELRDFTDRGSLLLETWKIEGRTNADELGFEVMQRAQDEAEGRGVHSRFCIRRFEEGCVAHTSQRTFEVRIDGELGDDSAPVEMRAEDQTMRHLENRERVFASLIGDTLMGMREMVDSQRQALKERDETIETMRARENETLELRAKLVTEEHARLLDIAGEARKDQIVGKGLELFTKYTPVLIGRLATGGKRGVPLPPMVGEEHIKNLLISITNNPEKMAAVAGALGPTDMAIVAELAAAFQAKEAEEEKKKALPPAPPKTNGAAS